MSKADKHQQRYMDRVNGTGIEKRSCGKATSGSFTPGWERALKKERVRELKREAEEERKEMQRNLSDLPNYGMF